MVTKIILITFHGTVSLVFFHEVISESQCFCQVKESPGLVVKTLILSFVQSLQFIIEVCRKVYIENYESRKILTKSQILASLKLASRNLVLTRIWTS